MAVTFNSTDSASVLNDASPINIADFITIPNTTGICVVGISFGESGSISAVTLGGATVNAIGSRSSNDQTAGHAWLGYVLHSSIGSTGSKELVITHNGGSIVDVEAGAVCMDGQNNADPVGDAFTAAGSTSNGTCGVTDSSTGDMIVAVMSRGGSITSSANDQRWVINQNQESAGGNGAGATEEGAAGTVNMTFNASSEWWAIVAVTVYQASDPSYEQSDFRFFNDDGTGLGEAA
jgi:hypothetical protein